MDAKGLTMLRFFLVSSLFLGDLKSFLMDFPTEPLSNQVQEVEKLLPHS
jgi:hypothetical protein